MDLETKIELVDKSVEFVNLTSEDLDSFINLRVHALNSDSYAFSTSLEKWRARDYHLIKQSFVLQTSSPNFVVGVFSDKIKLVGMIGFRIQSHETGLVWGTYLMPTYRGLGVGKKMMQNLISRAFSNPNICQIELKVFKVAEVAASLYRNCGFVEVSGRSDLMDGEQLMVLGKI